MFNDFKMFILKIVRLLEENIYNLVIKFFVLWRFNL